LRESPVLRAVLSDTITLQKVTLTEVDPRWGTQHAIIKEYQIKAKVFIVTEEDLVFERGSILQVGDAKGYLKPSYAIGMVAVTPEVGDRIVCRGITYEIQRLVPWTDRVIDFLEVFMKRV